MGLVPPPGWGGPFWHGIERLAAQGAPPTIASTITYTYDGLDRLTGATDVTAGTTTTYGYAYDLAGNRTGAWLNGTQIQNLSYNAANQVSGWTYDAAGNLLNDGTSSFSYDAFGRQISSTTGSQTRSNQYNGDGTLVAQTFGGTTTRYTQDLVAPLAVILSDGSSQYVYGNGTERLYGLSSSRTWYVHDALGSVRQTANDSGTILSATAYDPYGQPRTALSTPFGFTGELQQSGSVYLRARWYQPGSGVLTARDPFEGWAEQPYSLMPYQYAYANPALWTDPSGRCVPYLDHYCLPFWETGGGLNWQDFHHYWSTVGGTAKDAVVGPAQLLYDVATNEETRAYIARGAQHVIDDPLDSAGIVAAAAATPFTDIYQGIVCGDSTQLGRGLTGFGLMLVGARLARKPQQPVAGLEMRGRPVPPLARTLELALNPEAYLYAIAKKYGINLRGSGTDIKIVYDPTMRRGTLGLTLEAEGGRVIRIGPDAFVDEVTVANTIAYELSHARDYLRGAHKPHGDASSLADGTPGSGCSEPRLSNH